MEIIKKLTLIALLPGCGAGFGDHLFRLRSPQINATEGFQTAVGKTIFASLLINTIAMCTKDNFLPMKAFVPAAVIIGIGMGTLEHLDGKDLKKNPRCGANKRNSRMLQALVVAAGLTPIILSDSQSGKMLCDTLKPAGEFLIDAGAKLLDSAISVLSRGR